MADNTPRLSDAPQADDDAYGWTEDELIASGLLAGNIITLDPLSNDSGGNGKTLWSVADGEGDGGLDYDLLTADIQGVYEYIGLNNLGVADKVTISSGRILFDLSASLASLGADGVNGLAEGDYIHTEFVYAIRLGNGILSQGTIVFELSGVNDTASISGTTTGSLSEDAAVPLTGKLTVQDADRDQAHTRIVDNAASLGGLGTYSVDADGNWSYVLDNSLVQSLGAGQTATDTFTVVSADGTADTLVTVTINGVDDRAIVSSDTKELTETDAAADISSSGSLTISDPDSVASFIAQSGSVGSYGTFGIDASGAWTYAASSAHDEFAAGVIYTDVFSVQSSVGLATSVTIRILGTNDDPLVSAPVEETASEDEGSFVLDLLSGASDPDIGDGLNVANLALVSGDASGITVNGNTLTIDPDTYGQMAFGESTVITYSYDIVDGNGGSVSQSATITITGEDDDPPPTLYFQAHDGAHGRELWSYDGTTALLVADINPGTASSNAGQYTSSTQSGELAEFAGNLYFTAFDPTNGYELRRLEGAIVSLVSNINPGSADSDAGFYGGFVEFAGNLYFTARDPTAGYELRRLDTSGTVSLVADISSGSADSFAGIYGGFVEFGGNLYFTARDSAAGYELRKLDTAGNVSLVADINVGFGSSNAGQYGFAEYNGGLYFTAFANGVNELYKLGSGGAVSLVDIGAGGSNAGEYGGYVEFDGNFYFSAIDPTFGNELRRLDSGGAVTVIDISPGSSASDAGRYSGFVEFAGDLYFSASDSANGHELRKLDGTTGAVSLVMDINPGSGGSNPGELGGFAEFAGNLYFSAFDPVHGNELRRLDAAGTVSVIDLNPGDGGSNPGQNSGFVEFGGNLYFSANTGSGARLHRIDGTTGAVSFADGVLAAAPRYLAVFPQIV